MQIGDESPLAEAAAHCDDCLCWLENCEAECCHFFTFALTPRSDVVYLADEVRIHAPLTPDTKRYYELHGARVEGEIVVVPRASCERSATRLVVNMRCKELQEDFLCALHDGAQPDCCADFTLETASTQGWVVTPRCLFAYKKRVLPRPTDDPCD